MSTLHMGKDGFDFMSNPFHEYMQNRMKELGIDLSSDDYINNPKYKELYKSFVTEDMTSVTEAWWVEKNFVGQERLEKIYSPYAFGIERKLSVEEMKEYVWQKVLADKYPDKNRTQKDVWRYFHRDEGGDTDSKKGLIKCLEKLGFYLGDFVDDQDKVKLLFLLYCFEVENNVQLVPFLSNPSIENVDDSFAGLETKNGELMSYLKRNLANQVEDEPVNYHPEEFKRLAYKAINKKDIVAYIKENKDEIINLVYEKDDISAYDKTRYDAIVDKFSEYLDMLNLNTKLSDAEIVSQLYAIAYMQELLKIDKKYKIENYYYRYKTAELKTLNNEVNYGIQAKRKSQLALIRRVNKRFYRYAGKKEEAKYAAETEMYMDMMISRIYEANSLDDMLFLHNYFMNYTDAIFLLDKQIVQLNTYQASMHILMDIREANITTIIIQLVHMLSRKDLAGHQNGNYQRLL